MPGTRKMKVHKKDYRREYSDERNAGRNAVMSGGRKIEEDALTAGLGIAFLPHLFGVPSLHTRVAPHA
jgi:hypothetical protein